MSKFRSGLERKFASLVPNLPYEKKKFEYIKRHTYTPDFQLDLNTFVETKGLFNSGDRAKHLLVREQNPHLKVIFVFQDPYKTLTKRSSTTYADWCNKHNFTWHHIDHLPSDLKQVGTPPTRRKKFWEN